MAATPSGEGPEGAGVETSDGSMPAVVSRIAQLIGGCQLIAQGHQLVHLPWPDLSVAKRAELLEDDVEF